MKTVKEGDFKITVSDKTADGKYVVSITPGRHLIFNSIGKQIRNKSDEYSTHDKNDANDAFVGFIAYAEKHTLYKLLCNYADTMQVLFNDGRADTMSVEDWENYVETVHLLNKEIYRPMNGLTSVKEYISKK